MVYCTACGKPHKAKSRNKCKTCFDKANGQSSSNDNDDNEGDDDDQTVEEAELSEEELNKPVTEMVMADLINIINIVNAPMVKKLDNVVGGLNKTVAELDERVKLLESENKRKDEEIVNIIIDIFQTQKGLIYTDRRRFLKTRIL